MYPLSKGWRVFWWVFAIITVMTGVFANAALHEGYSWIPKGIGLVSFVVLWADVAMRFRIDRESEPMARAQREEEGTDNVASGDGSQPAVAGPGYVAILTVASTLTVLASVLGALVVTGLNNGYSFSVVAQEGRAATTQDGYSGTFDLTSTSNRICGGGDDYRDCVTMHVAMYNTVCTGSTFSPASLSASAAETCEELSDFIDDTKARLANCGFGCTTIADENGRWGWAYLQPAPVHISISNDNRLPQITYQEHCLFELGPITLGNCPGRTDR